MRCENCKDTGYISDSYHQMEAISEIYNGEASKKEKLEEIGNILSHGVVCPACEGDCLNDY